MLSQSLYKLELLFLKIIPFIEGLIYLTNTVLSYFYIDLPILSFIGGLSFLPLIFILISSFVFKFCIYHRLPIYYIALSDAINYYDIIIGIPMSNRALFTGNMIIAGLFILLIIYFKLKICKNH